MWSNTPKSGKISSPLAPFRILAQTHSLIDHVGTWGLEDRTLSKHTLPLYVSQEPYIYGTRYAQPGGSVLASTRSPASRSRSSCGPYSGERGRAIRPVLVDSRMPNGVMSFIKESIRVGFAELYHTLLLTLLREMMVGRKAYTSTIQLFVLMSSTFPPNWWVRCVIASRCSCLCLSA